jgi:hypothetical protein
MSIISSRASDRGSSCSSGCIKANQTLGSTQNTKLHEQSTATPSSPAAAPLETPRSQIHNFKLVYYIMSRWDGMRRSGSDVDFEASPPGTKYSALAANAALAVFGCTRLAEARHTFGTDEGMFQPH